MEAYLLTSSIKSVFFNSVVDAAIWNTLRAMNHGIRMMISGMAFDRLDGLGMFPYDHFKFYTIVPIIRIDWLSSIQTVAVVSVVRIVSDRPGSVSI